MLETFADPRFWSGLGQIILINIVLSGDNAVVIALAARALPPQQQRRAVVWGSGAAVLMRIVLTVAAVELLRLPFLKIAGGALLLWIAVKLLQPEEAHGGESGSSAGVWGAMKTILVADLVMSLDNVIAVAAAAKGSLLLLVLGLGISIPLVVFGSTLLLGLMERFPVIITIGAGLLGWVAGEMFATDPILEAWVDANAPLLHWAVSAAGAVTVVIGGRALAREKIARRGSPTAVPAAAPAGRLFNRILLPVDASDTAVRAAQYVIALWRNHSAPATMDIHLMNVQRELPGTASRFVPQASLHDYHRERGEQAIERARRLLDEAGVKYAVHLLVGKPWEAISDFAAAHGFDLIVMGSHGLGSYTGAALGSVAHGVAERSTVPVLLVGAAQPPAPVREVTRPELSARATTG
jgi:YjbE family integral membrane protein